jgi:hypothetical protein
METTRREEFGIWTLLLCALGCATFTCRGIIALAGREERMLEGVVFLVSGIVASLIVGNKIWQLAREGRTSDER